MTDLEKKNHELKIEVRSLLISSPLELTSEDLRKDYVTFFGKEPPLQELGYARLEEFLKDIPDVVKISWADGRMMLSAIPDESTKNLKKLVDNQRISRKDQASGRRRSHREWTGHSYGKSWINEKYCHQNRTLNSYPHNNSYSPPPWSQGMQARNRAVPSVPAYVRSQIFELVRHHHEGLPLTHFFSAFHSRFGVPLNPEILGFSTDYELLSSMSEVVVINQLSNGKMRVLSVDATRYPKERMKQERSQNFITSKNHFANSASSLSLPSSTNRAPLLCLPSSTNHAPLLNLSSSTYRAPLLSSPFSTSHVPLFSLPCSTNRAPLLSLPTSTYRAPLLSLPPSTNIAPLNSLPSSTNRAPLLSLPFSTRC